MSAFVFVEETPVTGRQVPVIGGTVVGRGKCDVVLLDPEVSRRHAMVLTTPAGPAIEDLGSTNGTWVNDRRIAGSHRLRAGDVVRFGQTVWHVHPGQESSEERTAMVRTPSEAPEAEIAEG
jgi:pSer/pThr/pTyr-binding forkhead associated (FHA) protein